MIEGLGIVSLAAALAYGLWLTHRPPSWLRTVVKTAAVAALAGAAFLAGAPLLLVLALAFSALGDAFLAGDARKWLQPGMAAFFVAHVLYVPLFLGIGAGLAEFTVLGWRLGAALAVVVVGALLLRWLWPGVGQMRYMVAVYVLAILAMVAASFTLPASYAACMAGAVAFMASDSILAVQLFKDETVFGRPKLAGLLIWFLYWGGQTAIAWPFVVWR
ncbi:putative membrane protein YhhN [Caulobacter ginsengisoli]|uniref:Membrane protein YhhN n=1 Tax=Caulobacter ginsengisoli TaxID=400775 RepID=A0ABU0IVJ9_9CAUL|nr:lysoplasmalogenase [Caulobacter ginsengisoli]MDQ0465376.1 putative membrane protein YhhN [Caulobacter ginsengisoli]